MHVTSRSESDSMRPRENGRNFVKEILKFIVCNENCCISIQMLLKYVLKGPTDNKPPGPDNGLAANGRQATIWTKKDPVWWSICASLGLNGEEDYVSSHDVNKRQSFDKLKPGYAYIMMTSSNGNIFRLNSHLCGEFTGEFPSQRPVTRSLDVSLISARINGWVNNREAGDLRRHSANYDVTVMCIGWQGLYWFSNGLLRHVTAWANTDVLPNGPESTNLGEIPIKRTKNKFRSGSSANYQPFRSGFNVSNIY